MPYAIVSTQGPEEGVAVGVTEGEAWENSGLSEQERANYRAIEITQESYFKALADPEPEDDQLGEHL
jgi:hypothetical protein